MIIFKLLLPLALLIIILPVYFLFFVKPATLPDLDYNPWWGPGLKDEQDTSIRPFKIKFSDEIVQDLKDRLRNTRTMVPPLDGVGFRYGFNSNELKPWITYWSKNYNFTEREKELNKYPQFKTNIQGLDIHFIRVKPKSPSNVQVLPLLLLHGWPGSVVEFFDAIPLLTAVGKGTTFAFEVIAPSLPGFGFSDAPIKPNFGGAEMAIVLRNLMRRLGYEQFYLQGGDLGSIIASVLATIYPKEVLGFHTNLPVTMSIRAIALTAAFALFPSLVLEADLVDRVYPVKEKIMFVLEESGYFHLHASKPDTIGIAMADSPAGLLAYIVEKFSAGTNPEYRSLPDGGLNQHFTKDQLIDNLMMYWVPNSFTSSVRLYAEYYNTRNLGVFWDDIPTKVPTWTLHAKHEIVQLPPIFLGLKYHNLLGNTVLSGGGHFFAMEQPGVFAKDVLKAIEVFRQFRVRNNEL